MKEINVKCWADIPYGFTGKTIWPRGSVAYYINGYTFHRVDGPAIISEGKTKEYYFNGQPFSQDKWFELLTQEEKILALLNPENF